MIAYSNLNLKPKEFWDEISPRDFLKMCEGFNFKMRRKNEQWLLEMKLVRWVGSLIYNTNVKKINQMTPDKLFPLPEFKENEIKKINIPTEQEMKEIRSWLN